MNDANTSTATPAVVISDVAKSHVPALKPFQSGALAEYGNSLLLSLIQVAGWEDNLRTQTAQIGQVTQFVTFHMTKAVLEAVEHNDKINLYKIFDTSKEVERLNGQFLVAFGVQKLEPDANGERINRVWTDPKVRDQYAYTAELKEKDEAEFQRRFNNRKRLNQRLSDAIKIATELLENKNTSADLKLEANDNGELQQVIENAPQAIAGEAKRAVLGAKVNQTGASHSPTWASLIKLAKSRQDAREQKSDQRSDLGQNRPAESVPSSMGMNDEAFGEIVNNLRIAITRQENRFSVAMVTHLLSIRSFINELTLPDVVAGKLVTDVPTNEPAPKTEPRAATAKATAKAPSTPASAPTSKPGAARKGR